MERVPCLDEAVLMRLRSRRSEEFLARVIDLFLIEAPSRLEEAWLGGRSGDARLVVMSSHILACLAGNVGAVAVRALALRAEAAAGSGDRARKLPVLLFELEVALIEAHACLRDARRALLR